MSDDDDAAMSCGTPDPKDGYKCKYTKGHSGPHSWE